MLSIIENTSSMSKHNGKCHLFPKYEKTYLDRKTLRWLTVSIILFAAMAPWFLWFLGARTPELIGVTTLKPLPRAEGLEKLSASFLSNTLTGLAERLPIRYFLIKKRSEFFFDLGVLFFPAPVGLSDERISLGKNGWVYLMSQFPGQCPSDDDLAKDRETIGEFVGFFSEFENDIFVTIAPDKSRIHREFEHPLLQKVDCFNERKKREKNIATTFRSVEGKVKFVDIWAAFDNEKITDSIDLYGAGDTHWNDYGKIIAIKTIVNSISPNLFNKDEVINGGFSKVLLGPYKKILLLDKTFSAPILSIRRTNVFMKSHREIPTLQGIPIFKTENQSIGLGRKNLISKKTVIIHDSFLKPHYGGTDLAKYFEDVTLIHIDSIQKNDIKDIIRDSERIIFESVERDFFGSISRWANISISVQICPPPKKKDLSGQ